ncbi:MAG: hypothetical protein IKO57_11165 [Treponema sp.]|nr:hypothetical protein [Treponema sp.]
MKNILILASLLVLLCFSCADNDDSAETKNDAKTEFLFFADSWKEPSRYTFSYSYTGHGSLSDTAKY